MMAHFDVEEFSRVWQTSATRDEAATRLGINPRTASNRARWLRDRGHSLRMFGVHRGKAPPAPEPIEPEELGVRRTFRRLRAQLRRQEARAVQALRDLRAARRILEDAR